MHMCLAFGNPWRNHLVASQVKAGWYRKNLLSSSELYPHYLLHCERSGSAVDYERSEAVKNGVKIQTQIRIFSFLSLNCLQESLHTEARVFEVYGLVRDYSLLLGYYVASN